MGGTRWSRWFSVRHSLDAAHEAAQTCCREFSKVPLAGLRRFQLSGCLWSIEENRPTADLPPTRRYRLGGRNNTNAPSPASATADPTCDRDVREQDRASCANE